MKTLYIDCGMGAAGDMLAAALLELLPEKEAFVETMNRLGIPGVCVSVQESVKCGVTGTHFAVKVGQEEEGDRPPAQHGHVHHGLEEIRRIVGAMPIPTLVKLDILAVYQELAQAESRVHGVRVEQIHFHEVGAMDAVADITAVCLLLHMLDVDTIVASPVQVGSGTVRCAHGVLPVPAPATAELLKGIPIWAGSLSGELCTPTGAALLKHFVTTFGPMPAMSVEAIGYGMGKRDFPQANCVRCLLGAGEEPAGDGVLELRCNLDDMTGEALGYAMEKLLEQGALDVFTTAVGMKKSRPGVLLTVLCREADRDKMVRLLFRHTTTLGIRETACRRHILERRMDTADTAWGPVRKKVSTGYGVRREKLEFDDLARVADERGCSLAEAAEAVAHR